MTSSECFNTSLQTKDVQYFPMSKQALKNYCTATVIRDSIWEGNRITTLELRYPRFIHCFDEKTEILAKLGNEAPKFMSFKKAKALSAKVAQYFESTGLISFVEPNAWVENQSIHSMVKYEGRKFSMLVTDKHRVFVNKRTTKNKFVPETWEAKDLLGNYICFHLPQSGHYEENQTYSKEELALMVWFACDGIVQGNKVCFYFRKQRKVLSVIALLKVLRIDFDKTDYEDCTLIKFDAPAWISDCKTETGEKKLPEEGMFMDNDSYAFVKQAILESDGCLPNNEFNTTSVALAEQVQVLAHLHGDAMNLRFYHNGSYKKLYKSKFKNANYISFRRDKDKFESCTYDGTVYCVSVPSSYVVVRRNGIVFVSGNCELMTHRCLVGESELVFDLPRGSHDTKYRSYKLSIAEFFDKWENGSKEGKSPRYVQLDYSKIDPDRVYTPKELTSIFNLNGNSNINNACRLGKIKAEKINNTYHIKGSDYIEYRKGMGTRKFSLKSRLQLMKLRCFDERTRNVTHTYITDCWCVGEKQTYTLKAGEYEVTATEDHLFLTTNGWKELKDIIVGSDSVFCMTMKSYRENESYYDPHKKIDGKWVCKWTRSIKNEVIQRQNGVCFDCGKLTDRFDIHHVKPKYAYPELAFDLNNVVALCKECHKNRHVVQGWQQGTPKCNVLPFVVTSITKGTVQKVYDLSVSSEYHNFFANNIVVHNCFSRNASSSRATPVKTILKQVTEEPVFFSHVGVNKPGMQAGEALDPYTLNKFVSEWQELAQICADYALRWSEKYNIHKQVVNRVLEPFMYMKTLVTSTAWNNFFRLRLHRAAQPDIQDLASVMYTAIMESEPEETQTHLPYITKEEESEDILKKYIMSTARCARVSYLTFDCKTPTFEKDKHLFTKLVTAEPMHASPLEHVATAAGATSEKMDYDNFYGWQSLRNKLSGVDQTLKERLLKLS